MQENYGFPFLLRMKIQNVTGSQTDFQNVKKVNTNRVFECKIQHQKAENYKIQIAGKQRDIWEMCVFNIYLVNSLLLPPCKIHLLEEKNTLHHHIF